MGDLTAY